MACKQLGGEQTKKIKSGRRWIMSRASWEIFVQSWTDIWNRIGWMLKLKNHTDVCSDCLIPVCSFHNPTNTQIPNTDKKLCIYNLCVCVCHGLHICMAESASECGRCPLQTTWFWKSAAELCSLETSQSSGYQSNCAISQTAGDLLVSFVSSSSA